MNKNSTYNKSNGRYVLGGATEFSEQFIGWWERYEIEHDTSDLAYILEAKYENRVDLLAHAFYGDSKKAWMILQYNDILDPDLELIAGKVLLMPTLDKITEVFKTSKLGGIAI